MSDPNWSGYSNMFGTSGASTVKGQGGWVDIDEHQENAAGILAEFEARLLATTRYPGVISGMTPTEDDVNDQIDIAAGVAFVLGQKAVGGVSVALAGKSTNTYFLIVDGDEVLEADAYKVTTSEPDDDELCLARFDWDLATTAISNFVDLSPFGVLGQRLDWHTAHEDSALSGDSGYIVACFIAPWRLCIRRPYVRVVVCGSANDTIFDIHTGANGATASIWSDADDRPTVNNADTDGAVVTGALPDQNFLVDQGELIELYVDAVATSATGAQVVIPFTYY